MTGHIRLTLIATAIAVLVMLGGANFARTEEKKPDVTGPVRDYQQQPTDRRSGETGGAPNTVDGRAIVYRRGTLTVFWGPSHSVASAIDLDWGLVLGRIDHWSGEFKYAGTPGPGNWNDRPRFFPMSSPARTALGHMWPGSAAPRGYAGCHAARAVGNEAQGIFPMIGQYVCYETGEHRLGELRFDMMVDYPNGEHKLTLSFVTWKN